ncbi:hypothetical protein [Natrialba sp. PRR66]|uniref:hypothetical protein n=1 Tax=Natrialba sp. PRR66 TaxID=3098146 RepID=UPI002B1E21CF|nr:hypothetical protein [Natrialba sp. PRR66]
MDNEPVVHRLNLIIMLLIAILLLRLLRFFRPNCYPSVESSYSFVSPFFSSQPSAFFRKSALAVADSSGSPRDRTQNHVTVKQSYSRRSPLFSFLQ